MMYCSHVDIHVADNYTARFSDLFLFVCTSREQIRNSTMFNVQIVSSPFLFTALAGPKRQVKQVLQSTQAGKSIPSVLQGSSKVARVPFLSRVFRASKYRPSLESLSTPAFFATSSIRQQVTKYPTTNTIITRKGINQLTFC
ncbi:Hypothetical Protein FCC1311_036522 [Hondaea fermentalgiana]|uniref:Uncharacterized protein n=1 Tax=Hondaea fermentalgiana TaxID=2315210 RepID=A0A2R5GGN9_9STRA|nr:Hypothetical Protein FCC1311_036522 [Hondaea fermentalgiana]|eukprot:GBG27431.1 Hypothetical Protein FCC1311_036522 [Hondaea fermentalgiana]